MAAEASCKIWQSASLKPLQLTFIMPPPSCPKTVKIGLAASRMTHRLAAHTYDQ